jgi:hypothetical protein
MRRALVMARCLRRDDAHAGLPEVTPERRRGGDLVPTDTRS